MNDTISSAAASGRALLIAWATDQDDWLRGIVASVLESSAELSVDEVHEAYEHMLVEKSLAAGTRLPGPTLVEGTTPGPSDPQLALISVENVKNVNALAVAQSISFNAKMTVVFGRNGSGKTGYARILKRLSSVRREQRILPDITAEKPTTEPPQASIRYRLAQVEETLAWTGLAGVAPFTRIDVFDAQDAPIHVDGDLTYVYAPTDVALFRHVAKAVEEVRNKLEEAKRERAPGANTFVGHFKRTVPFYPLVDALGASTDMAPLKSYGAVTKEEEAALDGLKETVEALGGQAIDAQLRSSQADLDLCTQASAAAHTLKTFNFAAYDDAVASLKRAQGQQIAATRGAFAADALPGFLTSEWRALVEAGEGYLSSLGLTNYPEVDDACIYCRQPMTSAAIALLKKYRDFSNGEHEKATAKERVALETLQRPLANLDLRTLGESIRRYEDAKTAANELPVHVRDAARIFHVTSELRRILASSEPVGHGIITEELQGAIDRVSTCEASFAERVAALKGKAEQRKTALAQAIASKDLLEARMTLRELLPSLEKYVERSKWGSVADGVLRRFKNAGKTLTDASKQASERLINHDFEKHFRDECDRLSAPHVNLDFKGQKGAAARRKQLRPEYRLSESLSEGEQKVIALADFLAEARLRTANSPVVFDDPVTSLDYERIKEVASRLAKLAQARQVIVFTHNIWFAVELLERFRDRKDECSYYDIRALDGRRGIVSGGSHPRSDSVNDLKKRINTSITEARKSSGETQDAHVFRGYSILRALCEVAVEAELFQGVVRRYEPNVRLTVLSDIKPLALRAAGEVIYPVYEETCRYIEAHSQPMEHLNVTRSVDEFERDFKSVLGAIDAYKKASG